MKRNVERDAEVRREGAEVRREGADRFAEKAQRRLIVDV